MNMLVIPRETNEIIPKKEGVTFSSNFLPNHQLDKFASDRDDGVTSNSGLSCSEEVCDDTLSTLSSDSSSVEVKRSNPLSLEPSYYPMLQQRMMENKYNRLAAYEGIHDLNFEKEAGIEFVLKHEEFTLNDVMVFYNHLYDGTATVGIVGDNGFLRQVSPCREFFVLTRLFNQRNLNYECKLPFTKETYKKARMNWLRDAIPLSMRKLTADQLDHALQEFDHIWGNPHTIPYEKNTKPSEDAYIGRTKGIIFENTVKNIAVNNTRIGREVTIDQPLPGLVPCKANRPGDFVGPSVHDFMMLDRNKKFVVRSNKIHKLTADDFEVSINERSIYRTQVNSVKQEEEFLRYKLKDSTYNQEKLIDEFQEHFNQTSEAQSLLKYVARFKDELVKEIALDQQVIGLSTGLSSNIDYLKKKKEKFSILMDKLRDLNPKLVSSNDTFRYVSEELIDEFRANREMYKNDYDEIMEWFSFYVDHGRMPYSTGSPETDKHVYSCSLALWSPRPSYKKDYLGNRILNPNLTEVIRCMRESCDNQIQLSKFYQANNKAAMIARRKKTVDVINKWHELMDDINRSIRREFVKYVITMKTDYMREQIEYAKANPDEVHNYKVENSPEVGSRMEYSHRYDDVLKRYVFEQKVIPQVEWIEYEYVTYKYDFIPDEDLYPPDQTYQTSKKNRSTKRNK